jgi:putative acetyltransferase
MTIRKIQHTDNHTLGTVIRTVLTEFGVNLPGTAYFDPQLFDLHTLFQTPGSAYFILEHNHEIVGGCGLFPTKGLPATTVELVKFYLLPHIRGQGLGKTLLLHCLAEARSLGYTSVYLETMPQLTIAVPLYERAGFTHLSAPMGDSGHFACTIWMLKQL